MFFLFLKRISIIYKDFPTFPQTRLCHTNLKSIEKIHSHSTLHMYENSNLITWKIYPKKCFWFPLHWLFQLKSIPYFALSHSHLSQRGFQDQDQVKGVTASWLTFSPHLLPALCAMFSMPQQNSWTFSRNRLCISSERLRRNQEIDLVLRKFPSLVFSIISKILSFKAPKLSAKLLERKTFHSCHVHHSSERIKERNDITEPSR